MTRRYNAEQCCHRCDAQKHNPELSAWDPSAGAAWRGTLTTTAAFRGLLPADMPLCQFPGFSIKWLKADVMHCLHLGLCQHLVACTLLELCQAHTFTTVPRNSSLKRKLRAAWHAFKIWCRRHRIEHSQPEFTPARCGIKGTQSPCMLSYAAKAHNTRIVCAWLAEACMSSPDVTTFAGRLRASCNFSFAQFSFLLDCSRRYLDEQPVHMQNMISAGYDFFYAYRALHVRARRLHIKRWALIPKFHAFMHCLEDMMVLCYSARYHTWYKEEDFVGCMGRIAAACHASAVGLRTLQLWWLGIRIRLGDLQL